MNTCSGTDAPAATTSTERPLCSYVVATYNCQHLVPVLASTAQRLSGLSCEICVCDGGSTDGTWQALQSVSGIRALCSAPDRGIYDAWNRALPHVLGSYVAFIGVDDEPQAEFLAAAAAVAGAAHAAAAKGSVLPGLLYGDVRVQRRGRVRHLVAPQTLRLLDHQTPVFDLFHPGSMVRSDLLDGPHTFDASFKLAGDFDFFLRQAQRLRQAGTRRLHAVQAVLKDEGVSRQPQALAVYAQELARIEAQNRCQLGHQGTWFPWLAALAHWPAFYNLCKDVSWYLRGSAVADVQPGPSGLHGSRAS